MLHAVGLGGGEGRVRPAVLMLMLFMAVSLGLSVTLDEHIPTGPSLALQDFSEQWWLSPGVYAQTNEGGDILLSNSMFGPAIASRAVLPLEAEFIALEVCLARPMPELPPDGSGDRIPAAVIMLASAREGRLDFSRAFTLYAALDEPQRLCSEKLFPRRAGDAEAVLQLQFMAPKQTIALRSISTTPLRESVLWQWTRRGMLALGLVLVMLLFRDYFSLKHPLRSSLALGALVAILFGCCVPVGLKADIFALGMSASGSANRMSPAFTSTQQMLGYVFPITGFAAFSIMHAVFFANATIWFGLLRPRRVFIDMLLLALVTETLQIFVPGRGPGLSDSMIDLVGVAVAALVLFLLRRSLRVRLLLQDEDISEDVSRLG